MRKTPQEFRRDNVKSLFIKVLQSQAIMLEPLDITVSESFNSDFTKVNLEFSEIIGGVNRCIQVSNTEAKGFVDGVFNACFEQYASTTPSLQNIKLIDYKVHPNFSKSNSTIGSDAKTEVTIVVGIEKLGQAEFSCISRSILHSSFTAVLQAFEFYINCDKTFNRIQSTLVDAQSRNRGDIIQSCMSDLSTLTGVNTYEKKERN